VKRSLRLLLERLTEKDSVGIVTYAGESRIALEPTRVTAEGRTQIQNTIEALRAGSGTAGAAGIVDAYRLATNRFNREWVNRVILCTDGDFNIGLSDPAQLQTLIEEKAKSGVFLSVLGYGLGNLKDSTMELLADKGNGNYAYVDSFTEARKVLGEQLEGTLVTVAKDVKVQVEFNPTRVKSYRLLGYENRALRDRDFNDDQKDAGDVGAGHQVTVLYEIEPASPSLAGVDPLRYQVQPPASEPREKAPHADELFLLRLRYKAPDGDQSKLLELPVKDTDREFNQASADFKFATAVAGYGMLLRNSPHKGDLNWDKVSRLAEAGLGPDREGYRSEFIDLVRRAQQLSGR
jgi:secreted protein with Ig-like and vWFA domain